MPGCFGGGGLFRVVRARGLITLGAGFSGALGRLDALEKSIVVDVDGSDGCSFGDGLWFVLVVVVLKRREEVRVPCNFQSRGWSAAHATTYRGNLWRQPMSRLRNKNGYYKKI